MAHQNTLVYWNAKARGWPAAVIAAYGKLPLKWDDATANAWPSTKEKSPFGQLPFITFADGHTVGQSGAIYRVLARKTGLDGGNDFDFNMSQQLIEEYQVLILASVLFLYVFIVF
jgi:glutathione S-transferase